MDLKKKYFFPKDLRDFLRSKGLPCSKPTILKYERNGVIPKPENRIMLGKVNARIYTLEEIENVAKAIEKNRLIENDL